MRRKLYPAYKSSGVEWLGDVPEHWEVKRLKYSFYLLTTKTEKRRNPIALENIESWTGRFIVTETEFDGEGVAFVKDDILFGKLRPYLAKVWKAERSGEAVGDFFVMRPQLIMSPDYVAYFLRSEAFIKVIDGSTFGSKMPRVGWKFMGDVGITFPPLFEQRTIAAFLDREMGRIDALVAKKERLIELLREKRFALISRAVTKGLDPSVKLEPSSVKWLGDVPEHWEVKNIRRVSLRVQTGNTPPTSEERYYDDGEIPWYGPSSFDDAITLNNPVKLINASAIHDGVARIFRSGTVMIVGIGATIGKVSSINENASCNQQITGVTFKKTEVDSNFITYQLKQLEITIRGIAPNATLAIFDQNRISDLDIVLPPLSEQEAIAAFLDRETEKIDALISKVETVIAKLKEYRTALISAAVTGKIDVREAA